MRASSRARRRDLQQSFLNAEETHNKRYLLYTWLEVIVGSRYMLAWLWPVSNPTASLVSLKIFCSKPRVNVIPLQLFQLRPLCCRMVGQARSVSGCCSLTNYIRRQMTHDLEMIVCPARFFQSTPFCLICLKQDPLLEQRLHPRKLELNMERCCMGKTRTEQDF
jgi:hypothetical protein